MCPLFAPTLSFPLDLDRHTAYYLDEQLFSDHTFAADTELFTQ